MAGPITWRSILGESLASASRPLEAAGRSMTDAFDRLGTIISNREQVNQNIVDRGDEAKTLAFKEALANAGSVEEVNALRSQREQMLGGIGNKFRAQLVGAENARVTTLMDELTKRHAFEDAQVTREQRPIVDKINSHYARGEFDAGDALVAANPNLRGLADLAKSKVLNQRQLEEQGWKREEHGWKGERQVAELKHWENQDRTSARQAAAQELQARYAGEARTAQVQAAAAERLSKLDDAAYKQWLANSPLDKGTLDTAAGQETFIKELKAMGVSPTQMEDILYNMSQGVQVGKDAKGNPVTIQVPVSTALKAVAAATENPVAALVPGWSRRGDDAHNVLQRWLGEGPKQDKELLGTILAAQEYVANRAEPAMARSARRPVAPSPEESPAGALKRSLYGDGDVVRYWRPGQGEPSEQWVSREELEKQRRPK